MTDWTKSTGATGTMMIRDTGTYVEFWLKAGSGTYNYQLPWSYIVNGTTSGTKYFRFEQGGDWQRLGRWLVTTNQTVTFKIGASGTSGLGGPTSFSHAISRAKIPAAPSKPVVTYVSPTQLNVTFTDGANNGAAIVERQIGYGNSPRVVQFYAASDGSTVIGALVPGSLYYFWARTRNSVGWGPWSASTGAWAIAGVNVNVGGVWKKAIPYVKVNGVWRVAHPYVRVAGVWKQAN